MVRRLSFGFVLATAVTVCGISYAGDDDSSISPFPVQQGFAISPVKLNLAGKDPLKVGWGSYLVNQSATAAAATPSLNTLKKVVRAPIPLPAIPTRVRHRHRVSRVS